MTEAEVRASMRRMMVRFWFAVDAESVVLFQYVFGAVFITWGLYGTFVADSEPPLTLQGAMGGTDVAIWYWLLVAGPLLSLTGKCMYGDLTYAGMLMQLTGDLVLSLALLAYVTGTVQIETWGRGAAGAFLGTALCISAAITLTRDVRRLIANEKRLK